FRAGLGVSSVTNRLSVSKTRVKARIFITSNHSSFKAYAGRETPHDLHRTAFQTAADPGAAGPATPRPLHRPPRPPRARDRAPDLPRRHRRRLGHPRRARALPVRGPRL